MDEAPEQLKAKIEQAKRLSSQAADPQTTERLKALIDDLEQQQEQQQQ